jgi:hypothetical protein
LCNFLHFPVSSSLLDPNILLSTLFSNTLSLCPSLDIRVQVSQPYKTTSRVMVLYILTFTFLDSRREDRRLWTEWKTIRKKKKVSQEYQYTDWNSSVFRMQIRLSQPW